MAVAQLVTSLPTQACLSHDACMRYTQSTHKVHKAHTVHTQGTHKAHTAYTKKDRIYLYCGQQLQSISMELFVTLQV